ncbi:glycosyltransferase family 4 protein [Halomicroarcula sp. GCM10025709]|uniref:glycosyltransferase family 4 protein n=1 Tax=Haloarcula TaxID=2237 RepID=UPI0024C20D3B|nr:glycosyltransferase [Halomicroarcula sp. YJ-61-S]
MKKEVIPVRDGQTKVLIFTFSTRGATSDYPVKLANGLAGLVEVHVVCPDSTDIQELFHDEVRTHPYQTELKSGIRSFTTGIQGLSEQFRLVREISPDVIHFPFLTPLRSVTLLPLLATLKTPMVGTIHDPISHSGMQVGPRNMDLGGRVNAVASHLLDQIIVHGQACRKQASGLWYPTDRISIVPHGLFDHFTEYDYESAQTEDDTVLFFGNIRPNKGYDRIPEILDRVEEFVPEITALIAGSPSNARTVDTNRIERTIKKLEDDDRIELHNRFIPNEEVGTFFSRATVTVLPYYDASFSGVAMIAYAFGVPIVATDVGDVGRLVRADKSGIVTENGSRAVADGITELLTDETRRRECRENIIMNRSRYQWENIAREVIDVYRTAVQE